MIYEFSAPKFVEKVENKFKMGGKDPQGNELYANNLYLTENGKQYAEAVYEKHCIIRDYFMSCGVSAVAAEEDACNMEHLITEETFTMMKNTLRK